MTDCVHILIWRHLFNTDVICQSSFVRKLTLPIFLDTKEFPRNIHRNHDEVCIVMSLLRTLSLPTQNYNLEFTYICLVRCICNACGIACLTVFNKSEFLNLYAFMVTKCILFFVGTQRYKISFGRLQPGWTTGKY